MSAESRKSKVEARCEAQRERILRAARQCFVESGFRAASMASLAETAGMSAGLIYRYFENKNAIILAIIQQYLDEVQADIRQLQAGSETVASHIMERFAGWQRNESRILEPGLFLEIAALATRDPQVAAALHAADRRIGAELDAWLMRAWQTAERRLPEAEVAQRVFVLRCFIEGLIVRAIKQPDTGPELLQASLSRLLAYVLPIGRALP
ncbi:MAG: TetR/AcrR family transcriptional regulator [Candidatus Competibacteraceae bacterium]|nr:TetR/AcrR family transcriptional regulator [Candidatus Competibacteraceae bacterium]